MGRLCLAALSALTLASCTVDNPEYVPGAGGDLPLFDGPRPDTAARDLVVPNCGAPGAACCPGGGCVSDTNACIGGVCQPCGQPGATCCPGQTACAAGGCCSGGQCVAAGATCGGGAVCAGGKCQPCGQPGQPCCPGGS